MPAAMHPEVSTSVQHGPVAARDGNPLHMHVVPRWKGDTNFMPVIGDVHVISEHIAKTLERIKVKLA
jgi:diadenosine tetraphosphate (Ap4A) HIT family hydrolase